MRQRQFGSASIASHASIFAGAYRRDGGSEDGTRTILEERRSNIARLVMEPDRGMYDALNKGISLATGEVVGILHADDVYAHGEVLTRVAQAFRRAGRTRATATWST